MRAAVARRLRTKWARRDTLISLWVSAAFLPIFVLARWWMASAADAACIALNVVHLRWIDRPHARPKQPQA